MRAELCPSSASDVRRLTPAALAATLSSKREPTANGARGDRRCAGRRRPRLLARRASAPERRLGGRGRRRWPVLPLRRCAQHAPRRRRRCCCCGAGQGESAGAVARRPAIMLGLSRGAPDSAVYFSACLLSFESIRLIRSDALRQVPPSEEERFKWCEKCRDDGVTPPSVFCSKVRAHSLVRIRLPVCQRYSAPLMLSVQSNQRRRSLIPSVRRNV